MATLSILLLLSQNALAASPCGDTMGGLDTAGGVPLVDCGGDDTADDDDDDGGLFGCSTGPRVASAWLVVGLALVAMRRRGKV